MEIVLQFHINPLALKPAIDGQLIWHWSILRYYRIFFTTVQVILLSTKYLQHVIVRYK